MKKCIKCKESKSLEDFNKCAPRKDGYQSLCRLCQNITAKKYYNENRENLSKINTKNRRNRLDINKQKFYNYLKSSECIDCGINNPIVLEFDHKNPEDKISEVGKMLNDGYSWENVLKEIEKCDVRCANCHRIKTAKDQNWYKGLT